MLVVCNSLIHEVSALQISCTSTIIVWPKLSTEPVRITIADLFTYDNLHIICNNYYVVAAKIKTLIQGQTWWCMACGECNRTLQPHGGSYKCTGSRSKCTSGTPRLVRLPPPVEGARENFLCIPVNRYRRPSSRYYS